MVQGARNGPCCGFNGNSFAVIDRQGQDSFLNDCFFLPMDVSYGGCLPHPQVRALEKWPL